MATLDSETIYDLISKNDKFQIPIYQRNYDWNENDIYTYFKDIFDNLKRQEKKGYNRDEIKYYIGNIVIYDHETSNGEVSMVVDGQQRMTSTIIIFAVLRKILKNEFEKLNNIDHNLRDKYWDTIENVEKITVYKNRNTQKIKLTNMENNDLLKNICLWENSNKNFFEKDEFKKTNLYKNFIFMEKIIINLLKKNEINDLEKLLNFLNRKIINAFKNTLVAVIKIYENKDQPSKIFETLNTTGKKLKSSDLIKSYIFFYAHDDSYHLSNSYINNVEKKLKNINEYNDLSKWYRHIISIFNSENFLFSKTKNNGLDIYKGFKKTFNNNEPRNIFNKKYDFSNIDDVKECIIFLIKNATITEKIYQLINDSKNNEKQTIYNKIFEDSWSTFYPLLHNLVFEYFEQDTNNVYDFKCINEKAILNEISNVAKLSMHITLSGTQEKNITRGPSSLYSKYKKDKIKYNNEIIFWDWIKKRKNEEDVQIYAYTKDQLKDVIKTSNIYQTSGKRAKLMLVAIEGLLTNFETSINDLLSRFEIEHIYPVNPSIEAENEYVNFFNGNKDAKNEFFTEKLHTIGNLTLIVPETNKKDLKNNPWSKKREIFKEKTTLKINENLCKYEKWDEHAYNTRTEFILNNLIQFLDI